MNEDWVGFAIWVLVLLFSFALIGLAFHLLKISIGQSKEKRVAWYARMILVLAGLIALALGLVFGYMVLIVILMGGRE